MPTVPVCRPVLRGARCVMEQTHSRMETRTTVGLGSLVAILLHSGLRRTPSQRRRENCWNRRILPQEADFLEDVDAVRFLLGQCQNPMDWFPIAIRLIFAETTAMGLASLLPSIGVELPFLSRGRPGRC